jgi:hypothetical protein
MMDDIVVSLMNIVVVSVSWCFVSIGIVPIYQSIVGANITPSHWLSIAVFIVFGLWLIYRLAELEKELADKNAEVSKLRSSNKEIENLCIVLGRGAKQHLAELEKQVPQLAAEVHKLQWTKTVLVMVKELKEKDDKMDKLSKLLRDKNKIEADMEKDALDFRAKLKKKDDEIEAIKKRVERSNDEAPTVELDQAPEELEDVTTATEVQELPINTAHRARATTAQADNKTKRLDIDSGLNANMERSESRGSEGDTFALLSLAQLEKELADVNAEVSKLQREKKELERHVFLLEAL